MTSVFELLASGFTEPVYLSFTKAQGILWSLADILVVFVFLRIADLAREKRNERRILLRYLFLFLSAGLTPWLLLSRSARTFFILECLICGAQFAILLYSLMVEWKAILGLLAGEIPDRHL